MPLSLIMSFLNGFYFLYLRVMSGGMFPPVLSAKEEAEYFRRCKEGDEEARSILIEHNLRLVAHIIKKYYTAYKEQEDLMSVGTIGLIKAIDTFDASNGTRFATYAGKCLQNEILMYFRSQKKISCETSINEALEFDKDGNPLTYLDIIAVDDDMVEKLDIKMKSELARRAIEECLTERERAIIDMRYGLTRPGKPLPQREIAEKLEISRSYVSRIEKSALDKIREYMTSGKGYTEKSRNKL